MHVSASIIAISGSSHHAAGFCCIINVLSNITNRNIEKSQELNPSSARADDFKIGAYFILTYPRMPKKNVDGNDIAIN